MDLKNSDNIEPVFPDTGLVIAYDQPQLQLCKPKLMALKTFSFINMTQARKQATEKDTTH